MQTEKINLGAFVQANLLAKLLIIQLEFNQNKDELIRFKVDLIKFCNNKIKQHFVETDNNNFNRKHLALFLLGNQNNLFYKAINKI